MYFILVFCIARCQNLIYVVYLFCGIAIPPYSPHIVSDYCFMVRFRISFWRNKEEFYKALFFSICNMKSTTFVREKYIRLSHLVFLFWKTNKAANPAYLISLLCSLSLVKHLTHQHTSTDMKCPFFIRSSPARCISSNFSHCFSISRLYSSWRLISSSAPRTSFASSSDITNACISLAQALQNSQKGRNGRNMSLLDTQECTHPMTLDTNTQTYLLKKDMNM